MAKGAIHYVKHLSEIQDHLAVDNVELAKLAEVAPNTISSLRRRKPVKKITRNKVKHALEARCRTVHVKELNDALRDIESRAGFRLTSDDVFQSAEWHAPGLGDLLAANSLDWNALKGSSDLNDKQVDQLKKGAFFTPYIRDRIAAVIVRLIGRGPDGLFQRQAAEDLISLVVDET